MRIETGQNKGLIEGGKTKRHQENIEQNGEKGEKGGERLHFTSALL